MPTYRANERGELNRTMRNAAAVPASCSYGFLVFVVAPYIAHAELLDLAGEGIASPAFFIRGVLATAAGVLERGGVLDAFEGGYGGVEQVAFAGAQALFRPVVEVHFPITAAAGGGSLRLEFGRQIFQMNLTARCHDGEPAAGVFQLAHIAGPIEPAHVVGDFGA